MAIILDPSGMPLTLFIELYGKKIEPPTTNTMMEDSLDELKTQYPVCLIMTNRYHIAVIIYRNLDLHQYVTDSRSKEWYMIDRELLMRNSNLRDYIDCENGYNI